MAYNNRIYAPNLISTKNMLLDEENKDSPNFDLDTDNQPPSLIMLVDVLEFISEASSEDVRRIVKFSESFSKITSIKEAAKEKGVSDPTYSQGRSHEKFVFCGKTFGIKK